MAKIIELPKLSPTMEEGTLVRWARNEGDRIDVDDLVAEVETDKATMEFRSFDRGVLLKKLVAEGATVRLGAPVAVFGQAGEDVSAVLATLAEAASSTAHSVAAPAPTPAAQAAPTPATVAMGPATPASSVAGVGVPARELPRTGPASPIAASTPGFGGVLLLPVRAPMGAGEGAGPAGTDGRSRGSPRVRRLARERGVALERVRGTGASGRITVEDVERASGGAEGRASASAGATAAGAGTGLTAPRAPDTTRAASQMRKVIARRLTESKRDVPHFYLETDLDVDALLTLREQLNEGADKDAKVSVTDLLLRACAVALREVPASNASWLDGTIVQHHRVDISLAVAIDDGLVTPVVRDVDVKPIRAISAEVRDLATRARARKLLPEEMTGGVFSLSNLGMFGVDRFSAVINPPESMILAVGATREVAAFREGQVVAARRCSVTLSCDHRVVDGALGAKFLQSLRALVEHPARILA